MTKKNTKTILIDTDLGDDVDDAAAIIMALNSPELEIMGITTVYQNTYKRAEMVMDLCKQYGRTDIPIYAGYGTPLIERPVHEESPIQYEILNKGVHYNPKTDIDAVDFIIQSVRDNPELIIVAMGAMTNLGLAFHRAPEIMKNVQIIAMGGMFTSSAPEWNLLCDPEAARIVMDFSESLTMFGLDVTKYCLIQEELLDSLFSNKSERMMYYRNGIEIFKEKTGYPVTFHDVLLIAYLIDPSIVELKQSDFTIELSGTSTRGAIVFKVNAYEIHSKTDRNFRYATKMDEAKFRDLVIKRIS
ncbi:nucleoside hydrolase [Fusibacter ferrireducens]|uniref:Nucleoside hydrolase n=1 Tax=Fusibacter ferrireducens TaxID=2785058 RepID=A0ABR9ZNE1_9FIRM|nr:nucleoside hydrolase [Fusibacter ferrireducens]MBF4691990.1 nucleoside hydrolase [Fusibacter ferrireducens]